MWNRGCLGCRGRPFVQYPFGHPFLSKFPGTGYKGLFQGGRRQREGRAKKKKGKCKYSYPDDDVRPRRVKIARRRKNTLSRCILMLVW